MLCKEIPCREIAGSGFVWISALRSGSEIKVRFVLTAKMNIIRLDEKICEIDAFALIEKSFYVEGVHSASLHISNLH